MPTISSLTTKNNILIIDGQLFQNDTFHRGMGRYSLKLLESLFLNKFYIKSKYSQVILLLNKNIHTDKKRVDIIKQINPKIVIDWIKYPPINHPISRLDFKSYQEVLDKYLNLKYSHKKITFFILSNFEVFHTLSVFPSLKNSTKILLFYDLIPHLFFKQYLYGNITYIQEYYSRFINIFQSDHIFTISETTKNDLTGFININPSKITNINGALINNTKNTKKSVVTKTNDEFFLCTSGDDIRKNNDKTIEAFSKFSLKNKNKYSLIITSNFSDQSKQNLLDIKNNINPLAKVIFCGNISDKQLEYYYKKCVAVIFIPSYEGLGLPILEAVNYNKKVIASDIPVFKEITSTALYYCDPKNIDSVIQSFEAIVTKNIFDFKEYKRIKNTYTWDNTASLFFEGISSIPILKTVKKLKIALAGPILTGYSAIAKYCEDIYPGLLDYAEVDYFFDEGQTVKKFRESYLPYITNYYDIKNLDKKQFKQYDYFFYNLGNSEFHINIYKKACVYPGILIVHDGTLAGMFEYALQNNLIEKERYEKEKLLETGDQKYFLTSILNSSLMVFVHSLYVKNLISSKIFHKINIIKADLPTAFCINRPKNYEPVVISLAGIISSVKGTNIFIDTVKDIYKKYRAKVFFKIFGYDFNNESHQLEEFLSKYPCKIMSNLSDLEYQNELANTNILVNFRQKYNGETSKSCIDAFRHGVVTIVNNIGWFSEIPDSCCIKVNDPSAIVEAISNLINNPKELKSKSNNSIKLAMSKFNIYTYTNLIFDSIKNLKTKNTI